MSKSAFLNERDSWCAIFLIVSGERAMFLFIRPIVAGNISPGKLNLFCSGHLPVRGTEYPPKA